ncbi:uncharacterized protein LOC131854047 [Achroia grisella]|uniref:uncharacterized protein LOC131854047 n=1 Tax=Achroia grisella TaxID=688607 RepID=UPI0027D3307E|nr:uncharacterized protein LOC131854047 [Achroia grisella]
MVALDLSVITLISINVVQMVIILLLLLPIVDLTTLSRSIRFILYNPQLHNLMRIIITMYVIFIIGFGILGPTRTLNNLKYSRLLKKNETSKEKLIRIIDSTNATRNSLLAGFSLFFTVVALRLFDYVKFSAKLYEFSNLMGNYDLVDVTVTTEIERETESFIIDQSIEEDEDNEEVDNHIRWPSIANLNKIEHKHIKTFLKEKTRGTDKEDKNITTQKTVDADETGVNKPSQDNSE